MEKPEFWLKKIKNPGLLILTSEQIGRMNEEILKREDLYFCNLKDLKEDWTREELLSLFEEDLKGFGRTNEIRYGRNGLPLGDSFWSKIEDNLNQGAILKNNKVLFGLVVHRTDLRVFPTDEPSLSAPRNDEFDRFQHSSLSPGSPVGVYLLSKDKEWAYVQTYFVRGWIHAGDLAIAPEKSIVTDYWEMILGNISYFSSSQKGSTEPERTPDNPNGRLVVTGNFIKVFDDPSCRRPLFPAQMGDTYPLLGIPGKDKKEHPFYVIQVPSRGEKGELILRNGYIRPTEDVHQGFLPYTREIIARQAFKMLNHPYGWGDLHSGRDCSRFTMDIFRTFGILISRNSKFQVLLGTDLGAVEGIPVKEKKEILDQAMPFATLLRMPGHIMLYLGKDNGRYYVIHDFWGFYNSKKTGTKMIKIGKTTVSDLSLGEKGPYGSFLDRITHVRTIGSNFEALP